MSRNKMNFVIDSVSLLVLLALAVTGIVLKYVLPPGTGGMGRILHGGSEPGVRVRELWSMTRHDWGDIHFYLSVLFLALMVVHLLMHWRWIKSVMKSAVCRYRRE